jgi:hypothetical protein
MLEGSVRTLDPLWSPLKSIEAAGHTRNYSDESPGSQQARYSTEKLILAKMARVPSPTYMRRKYLERWTCSYLTVIRILLIACVDECHAPLCGPYTLKIIQPFSPRPKTSDHRILMYVQHPNRYRGLEPSRHCVSHQATNSYRNPSQRSRA